jgi:LmbE family N-acetylglucosaminyl deacetylase
MAMETFGKTEDARETAGVSPMNSDLNWLGRTLVIAPHPDDEVLGAGGTIARLAEAGHDVFVAIVTTGKPPTYSVESVTRVKAEAKAAHDLLGVKETYWLDQPAAELTEVKNADLNNAIDKVVKRVAPKTIFAPFVGDMHVDHQLVFRSIMVASRPHQAAYPRTIMAYETLSETNWNAPYVTPSFIPNVFIDISNHLERKIAAMEKFTSQLRAAPHERSIESLQALATMRGATVHHKAAESFVLMRHVW